MIGADSRKIAAVLLSLMTSGASSAFACSCPGKIGESPAQRRDRLVSEASFVATVEVLDFRIQRPDKFDPIGIAQVELVRTLKGELPRSFEVRATGGDQSANCGAANVLFEAVSSGLRLTASMTRDSSDGKDIFWIVLGECGITELEEWNSATKN